MTSSCHKKQQHDSVSSTLRKGSHNSAYSVFVGIWWILILKMLYEHIINAFDQHRMGTYKSLVTLSIPPKVLIDKAFVWRLFVRDIHQTKELMIKQQAINATKHNYNVIINYVKTTHLFITLCGWWEVSSTNSQDTDAASMWEVATSTAHFFIRKTMFNDCLYRHHSIKLINT